MPLPPHSKLKFIADRIVYQGYLRVQEFTLQFQRFDHSWSEPITRQVLARGEAVVVVPYDPKLDQILLIEQFRLPAWCRGIEPWLLEFPAGMSDAGEAPETVARREMLEETGLDVLDLRLMHTFLPSPGALAETIHLFLGRCDLSPLQTGHGLIHGKEDEAENIRLVPMAADEMGDLIDSGKIANATALLGLYWLLRHRAALRQAWGF